MQGATEEHTEKPGFGEDGGGEHKEKPISHKDKPGSHEEEPGSYKGRDR